MSETLKKARSDIRNPTSFFLRCRLLELREAQSVDGLATDLELHEAEAAAGIGVVGGILFGVVDKVFFHAEQLAHELQDAGRQELLLILARELVAKDVMKAELPRLS